MRIAIEQRRRGLGSRIKYADQATQSALMFGKKDCGCWWAFAWLLHDYNFSIPKILLCLVAEGRL